MPTPPYKGESKEEFIARAVRMYLKEGYKKDQALAIAFSMWKKHKKMM